MASDAKVEAPHAVSQRRRPMPGLLRDRPVLSVFLVALVLRASAAVVVWSIWGGTIFGDEATYSEMATAVVEGRIGPWDEYTHWLYWDTATWTLPLTGLYALVGPSILMGQLLSAVMGAAAATLTARIAIEALPVGWAVLAGLFVAVFPSQILWSSLTLKDAAVWAVAAAIGLCVARAAAVGGRAVWGRAILLVVVLVLMAFLRTHTFVVVTWAAGIAIALAPPASAATRRLAGLMLIVLLPWTLGLGPAALGFVLHEAETIDSRRFANALGASTAIVDLPDAGRTGGEPSAGTEPGGGGTEPGGGGTGPGRGAPGRADRGATGGPSSDAESMKDADLRHLPRGLVLMLLDPLPGMVEGNQRVRLAAAEHVMWYPMLLLAVVGLPAVWGNRRVLAYPALAGAATILVYALVEGNFGTAYRHRGEVVWMVSLLAAFGARRLWGKFQHGQDQST